MPISFLKRNLVIVFAGLMAAGCHSIQYSSQETWPDNRDFRKPATDALALRWTKPLVPALGGAYKPVQGAIPLLSPLDNRVYIGTSTGHFWALNGGGGPTYQYNALGAIESEAAMDRATDQVYLGTEDGVLHALRASDGKLRWRTKVRGPVRQAPVLTKTLVLVVSDDDELTALDRRTGKAAWSYHRDPPEGFTIAGHAGLALAKGMVLTGFSDGVVVALNAQSGKLIWERDTAIEIEQASDTPQRFVDVDTTPVVVEDVVYVASFSGGLFELSLSAGGVDWHRGDWSGVTAISATQDTLVMSSADLGVLCVDRESRKLRWRRQMQRGAPSRPSIVNAKVIVGESRGALLALALDDGRELSRIASLAGFAGGMSVADGRGYVLSNSGELFAFAL